MVSVGLNPLMVGNVELPTMKRFAVSQLCCSRSPRGSRTAWPSHVGPSFLSGLSRAFLQSAFAAEVHDSAPVGALFASQGTSKGLEIVPVFLRDRGANCPNFLNDWVSPHEPTPPSVLLAYR